MKHYNLLLFGTLVLFISASESKMTQKVKVNGKTYVCLFKMRYEKNTCLNTSQVSCSPKIKGKKKTVTNVKLALDDGTIIYIRKLILTNTKKAKIIGCKAISPITSNTIQSNHQFMFENHQNQSVKLAQSSGTMTCFISPGYPSSYPNNIHHRYTISVSTGYFMEITFEDFDVEYPSRGSSCPWDYVEFSDGYGKSVSGKLCGRTLPSKFSIPTSTASVVFHSDNTVQKKGFKFCYKEQSLSVYLIAGGWPTLREIELYNPITEKNVCAITPPSLDRSWGFHTVFYHDSSINLCGGYYTQDKCASYNSRINKWKTHKLYEVGKTYSQKRYFGHSSIVFKNTLYLIGGVSADYQTMYEAVSTSLPLEDKVELTPVPNLSYKGSSQRIAKVDEDSLVITGGRNDHSWLAADEYNAYITTGTLYNIKTRTETSLPPLKQIRTQHGCVVIEMDNKKWVVIAGGLAPFSRRLKSTEMLELGGSSWVSLGNLNVERYRHGMIVTEVGIMVMGGQGTREGEFKSVEVLDWATKKWKEVQPSLKKGSHSFGEVLEIPASMFSCGIDCAGSNNDWSCCNGQCGVGEGDCDNDDDCFGDLICGGPRGDNSENCRDFNPQAARYSDCCVAPNKCGVKKRGTKIVGGNPTQVNEYPWIVSLSFPLRPKACGGSVIGDRWILTAAHCVDKITDPATISVTLGEHDTSITTETLLTKKVNPCQIIIHDSYESFDRGSRTINDLALLRLPTAINVNVYTPICLPPLGKDYTDKKVWVYGWGRLSEGGPQPSELQELEITVVNDALGKSIYGLTDAHLAAMVFAGGEKGKNACHGDSGSPLSYDNNGRHELVGAVSWSRGCAREGFPAVYTEISAFRNWIDQKIGGANTC